MNTLTEGLNILRCSSSISVKGNEGRVGSRKPETHVFSTVTLVQCHRHVYLAAMDASRVHPSDRISSVFLLHNTASTVKAYFLK
jgi:hypothetical protein